MAERVKAAIATLITALLFSSNPSLSPSYIQLLHEQENSEKSYCYLGSSSKQCKTLRNEKFQNYQHKFQSSVQVGSPRPMASLSGALLGYL